MDQSKKPSATTTPEPNDDDTSRLKSLFADGKLVHPYLSREFFQDSSSSTSSPKDHVTLNFVDLAASLAICCGVTSSCSSEDDDKLACTSSNKIISTALTDEDIQRRRLQLAAEIDGGGSGRKHIVLILCDGMGNSILQNTLNKQSFLNRNNQTQRLRAVFPSTTPAALTSLATASWPGIHGMPGWNLRGKMGCDFPGMTTHPPVQLLVLSDHIKDAQSGKLASEMGFDSWDEVFVEQPWARHVGGTSSGGNNSKKPTTKQRRMIYINAYNGDDYQEWSQGTIMNDKEKKRKHSDATDFSEWQMGKQASESKKQSSSTLFETAKIEETAFDTLGEPKGSVDAIQYYRDGINAALDLIAKAERHDEKTFTYLYTAHPDKHMHALGVEHIEVRNVVHGIERETERFWRVLGDREALLSGTYDMDSSSGGVEQENRLKKEDGGAVDATVVLTADHGHVTVHPEDMVVLPECILELLEYACIGVHGKGRHGYLHTRAGLQKPLQQRWKAIDELHQYFRLLTIEEAIEIGLFGPKHMRMEVRPRLGDFVSISIGTKTLVTPMENEAFCHQGCCQGAHGSLNPEEMHIPFILLEPSSR